MNAVAIMVVSLVVILLVSAVIVLRRNASPAAQYRRELRRIRRLRGGIRAGDPNSTTIGPNSDATMGYGTGSVGP